MGIAVTPQGDVPVATHPGDCAMSAFLAADNDIPVSQAKCHFQGH